jgi:hypothetical protein
VIQEVDKCNNLNECNPKPPLYIHLKPVRKQIFWIKVLAETGAVQSLISFSTAAKHGCKFNQTSIKLRAANGTEIDVAGTTSLQVVKKGHLVHTIVSLVLPNLQQTIIGWQDLRAIGVIHAEWPTMPPPPPTTKDKICALDEEERKLANHSVQVQQRKERETGSINAVFITPPPPKKKRRRRRRSSHRPDGQDPLRSTCQPAR